MKKLIIFILLVLAAAPASAQSVKVKADRSVDLARYKTYAWTQPLPLANPIILKTILDAVDQAMAAKGLKLVDSNPELRVAFWTATESDLHVTYPTRSSPTAPTLANATPAGSVGWPVSKGTFVVSLVDTATSNNVWRATASHTLEYGPSGNAAEDAKRVEKPIRKAVTKMFKQFPRPN
jgi:hypothetical protein